MRSSNCRCSLIVEGGLMRKYHPKVPITKRAAMRSRLIYQYGIDVIETIDLRETAYAITVAIRDLLLDPNERSLARPKRTQSNNPRSEERRVGNECGSTCSYRWSACHKKKNKYRTVTVRTKCNKTRCMQNITY